MIVDNQDSKAPGPGWVTHECSLGWRRCSRHPMPVRAPVAPFRSIDDVISLAKARAASLVLLLVCCAGLAQPDVAFADWPALRVSAAQLEYGDLRFKEVRAALTEDRAFEVSFDAMQGSGESLLGDGLTLNGIVRDAVLDRDALQLSGGLEAWGLTAELTLERSAGNLEAQLVTANQPVTLLADLGGLPPEIGWVRDGVFEAVLRWRQTHEQPPELTFSLAADGLSFDSPDGQFAGELLRLTARGSAAGDALSGLRVDGAIERGELLVKDFYRDFGEAELGFGAHLRWTEAALEVADLSLRDDTALSVAGSAMLGLGPHSDEWSLRVDHLGLRFPGAYRRYLEPLAAAWTLDGLELTGSLRWAGEWSSMGLTSGNLDIVDLSVVDTRRGRFALTGLETQLRPGDYRFDSRLSWRGLIFGRINLGAGQATLDSEPGAVALLEPLPLDVLGGRLELQRLKVVLPGRANPARDEPDIQLQARLDGVDMEQLTAALGWPSFTGKLSGEIPGVALSDGVLEVEGEIRVHVFDGLVMLQNLRMERPFGVLPSLAADVEVTNLDLDQLTHTFSFGHISGRLDGYVRELRMLDWKPVAFDAWLGTPVRQKGANDISRQAVNHLTTIGGGPVTTALTNPLLRMFTNFSYRRLGLGCRLVDYVCELRGLSGDPDSVLILEGAGIPKITIRAFNRRVDWPQMVANLLAISSGQGIQIGDDPET